MRLGVNDQAKRLNKNDSSNNGLFDFVIRIGKDLAARGNGHEEDLPVGIAGSCGNHQIFPHSAYLFLSVSFLVVFFGMTMPLQIGKCGLGAVNISPGLARSICRQIYRLEPAWPKSAWDYVCLLFHVAPRHCVIEPAWRPHPLLLLAFTSG